MANAGTDPGFPVGGLSTLRAGAPTYVFAKFSKKTAWNWENVGPGGGGGRGGRFEGGIAGAPQIG